MQKKSLFALGALGAVAAMSMLGVSSSPDLGFPAHQANPKFLKKEADPFKRRSKEERLKRRNKRKQKAKKK